MKKFITVILAVILIAGISLLAYPGVSDQWNRFHQTHAVMGYAGQVDLLEEEDYAQLLEAAYAYNRMLAENGADWEMDEEEMAAYTRLLNIESSGIMGYVKIPKIHVTLPICHGTDETVLQTAVGHLEMTSLPVGCESYSLYSQQVTDKTEGSHCVISGHRGLPSAKLFTDLDRLTEGDRFSITVLHETLVYEVDQIRVVEPDDLTNLQIVPGKDYCTLLTCTPYGVNTHRLLVRGHRIGDDAAMEPTAFRFWPDLIAPTAAAIGLLLLLFVLAIVTRKRKKKRRPMPVMQLILLTAMLSLLIGGKTVQAKEADSAYSLTVNMAADDFIKEDPDLADVTLNIYKIPDSAVTEAEANAHTQVFAKEATGYVTARKMEATVQTTFGTPEEIGESGVYVVIPARGDTVAKDAAGNVAVTTDQWIYTFCPAVISVPTDTVIYVKAERQPVRDGTIPEALRHDRIKTIADSTMTVVHSVKTGDDSKLLFLLVMAAATALIAMIRHKKTDIR